MGRGSELALEKIKTRKASGIDGIDPELVNGGPELIKKLLTLFLRILVEKRILKKREYKIIISIRKRGNTSECKTCRPICLSSVIYKMYILGS